MNYLSISAIFFMGCCIFSTERCSGASLVSNMKSANQALLYLSRFGYVDPRASNAENGALLSAETVRKAIVAFQNFAGLNQTGELDEETQILMNTPRCGVKDKVGYGSNARKKRYALQGSRWKVKHLTYRITQYPTLLTKKQVDYDIFKAFKVWSDITELTFEVSRSGKVHIEIRFEKDEHGDGDAFDGPGGTLAHAYFPIYGGDAHFDDTETWTVNSYRGTNLFQVAAHEFGHSLGLSHSDVRTALMAPFYRGYQEQFKLDHDDITAIQTLYGKKTPEERPTPFKPAKPDIDTSNGDDPVLCQNNEFDAITTMKDNKTYVFKGSNFWKLSNDGIASGYPKKIRNEFTGLFSYIDAAFTWTNGKTYFFKGSKYYRFTDMTLDNGYPKEISKGFAGIPDNVDAAFVWSGNGKIYFFKGTNYFKFDPTKTPPVEEKYPKDIALWEGLPYYMDAAMQYYNGYTYFFKNGKYWRFNDRSFKVDHADVPFPRLTGPWWFGCSDKGSHMDGSVDTRDNSDPVTPADTFIYDDDSFIGDDPNDQYYDDNDGAEGPQIGFSISPGNEAQHLSSCGSVLSLLVFPLLLKYICS